MGEALAVEIQGVVGVELEVSVFREHRAQRRNGPLHPEAAGYPSPGVVELVDGVAPVADHRASGFDGQQRTDDRVALLVGVVELHVHVSGDVGAVVQDPKARRITEPKPGAFSRRHQWREPQHPNLAPGLVLDPELCDHDLVRGISPHAPSEEHAGALATESRPGGLREVRRRARGFGLRFPAAAAAGVDGLGVAVHFHQDLRPAAFQHRSSTVLAEVDATIGARHHLQVRDRPAHQQRLVFPTAHESQGSEQQPPGRHEPSIRAL